MSYRLIILLAFILALNGGPTMDSLTTTPQRDLIFISYSHQDMQWLTRLQILLKPFIRENQIKVWADPYIQVGDRWERKIDEALNRTKIAVLLVSPNFLASDFIADIELPAILEAGNSGRAILFCIPISTVQNANALKRLLVYQWARDVKKPLGLIQNRESRNTALVEIVDILVAAFPPVLPQAAPEVETGFTLGKESHTPKRSTERMKKNRLGVLHGIPPQRPHFLPRPDELNRLKVALLAEDKTAVGISGVASKFGLHGQGGIGKSVLAIALVNDDEVRQVFPDGIYWITLGQTPDILGLQDNLITAVSGKRTDLTGVEPCKKVLKELFEGKCCLLVLDDLWRYEDTLAFDVLDSGSKLLITTRDATLLTALGAQEERLDRVDKELALELLAQWSDQPRASLPQITEEIVEHCGWLPLALALAGARVRDGTGWDDLQTALERGHLEFLDHPYGSIFKSMRCSVEALPPHMRQRYLELAIFPEDVIIPEETVFKLWHQTGGLDALRGKSLLTTFERKGLIYLGQGQREAGLTFHDLQQDFLRLISEDLPVIHTQLLKAYRNDLGDGATAMLTPWYRLPAEDRYIWSYLAYHLTEGGHFDEVQALVHDLRYLAKKIFLFKVFSIEGDLAAAERAGNNQTIEALRRNLAQSTHMLIGFSQMEDLLRTLYTRLSGDSALVTIVNQFESSADISFLKPLWPMPDRPHPALIRTLEGHTDQVWCCAVDPEGRWIVSGADDRTLRLWDVASGQTLRTFEGHTGGVRCCAVDPQGKWVVSGADDGTLRLWDVATGQTVCTLEGHTGGVRCCAVGPQGKWIVSGAFDGTVRVWDTDTGRALLSLEGHTGKVKCCAVDPQGKWIVTGDDESTLRLWNVPSGQVMRTLENHLSGVWCCAVDPHGKWIVSSDDLGTLSLWDVTTGQALRTLEGQPWVNCCAVEPQGKWIVSGDAQGNLWLWDVASGQVLCALEGHTNLVTCCAVDPQGQWIVSGADDCTVRLWDPASGRVMRTVEYDPTWVTCCAVDPQGQWIVSGARDGTVRLWDPASGQVMRTLEGHTHGVTCCAADPQGKWIVSGAFDGTFHFWDVASGQALRTLEGQRWVNCCAVDPQGKWIVSGGDEWTLRLWDVASGQTLRVLEGHTSSVKCCAVDPQGQWVVSGDHKGTLHLWNVSSGQVLRTLEGHTGGVRCCAVDPQGNWVVSGADDGTLCLWGVASGQTLHTIEGHTGELWCCAVDPQGNWIVSGASDGTVRLWDTATKSQLMVLRVDDSLSSCVWLPNGQRIVASGKKGLYLFELRPRQQFVDKSD